MGNSSFWHLVYCKAKNEQRAEAHFANQGIVSFFPVFSCERVVRGKRTMVTEPVFPNYLFVDKPEHVNYTTIRSTRGVSDFVRMGQKPVTVPSELVYQLMARSDTPEMNAKASRNFPKLPEFGDKVVIQDGPYRGLDAIYQKADGMERSILLIKLIQQDVQVCLDNRELQL
ncbi:MAG: Transcription antitermination protein RfaH [Candidatus Celerinatantimonas neptuna]|nr:MAG: Transcription antitermination protein RfaH [Candidatus Celerinatantimonas neptuna]